MIDESIISALVDIEREAVRASELADLSPLRGYETREQRFAALASARQRRLALYDRFGVHMNNDVWTAYRGIARAEAEAIEWRAYAARLAAQTATREPTE